MTYKDMTFCHHNVSEDRPQCANTKCRRHWDNTTGAPPGSLISVTDFTNGCLDYQPQWGER